MRGQPFVFTNLSGGLNKNETPYAIDSTQAREALNVESTPHGSFRKRRGFGHVASPAKRIHSLFPLTTTSVTALVGIADDGAATDAYSITTAGSVTSIKGAVTISLANRWDAVQAPVSGSQGPLFLVNGVDAPLYWTGSGNLTAWTASAGTLPNGRYIEYHDNAVWQAGTDSYAGLTDLTARNALYRSALADPRVWDTTTGARTTFDPEDGQRITALGKVGPYLLVCKPHKSYIVHDSTTLAYRRISDEIGCVANKTVCDTDQGTIFLSKDHGVVITDGAVFEQISVPVQPVLDSIAGTIANASAVYRNHCYYLSIPIGSENDLILMYDLRNGSWWQHKVYLTSSTTTGVNDWARLNPQTTDTLYAAGSASGTPRVWEAYKTNTFRDRDGDGANATPYLYQWVSGWHVFGEPHIRKIIRQIRADASGEYSCYTARSFGTTFNTEQTTLWEIAEGAGGGSLFGGGDDFGGVGLFGDSSSPVQERRFYTPGTARAMSVKFEGQNEQDFELYSYTMAVDRRSD